MFHIANVKRVDAMFDVVAFWSLFLSLSVAFVYGFGARWCCMIIKSCNRPRTPTSDIDNQTEITGTRVERIIIAFKTKTNKFCDDTLSVHIVIDTYTTHTNTRILKIYQQSNGKGHLHIIEDTKTRTLHDEYMQRSNHLNEAQTFPQHKIPKDQLWTPIPKTSPRRLIALFIYSECPLDRRCRDTRVFGFERITTCEFLSQSIALEHLVQSAEAFNHYSHTKSLQMYTCIILT